MCFEQALEALQRLPEHRDTHEQAIDLRFDLRTALFPLGDFGRILDLLHEAESLAEALGNQGKLGRVSAFMTVAFHVLGDMDRALASGQRTLRITEALGDSILQVSANFGLGSVHYSLGDYRRAMDFLGRNVAALTGELLYQSRGGPSLPSVTARTFLVLCLAELGVFAEGVTRGDEGIRIAEAVDRPYSLIQAYHCIGVLYLRKGDLHQAIAALERGLGIHQAWPTPLLFPLARFGLGPGVCPGWAHC